MLLFLQICGFKRLIKAFSNAVLILLLTVFMCEFDKDFQHPETQSDLQLLYSIIQERDRDKLAATLEQKGVGILNCNNDGYYSLHEAVDLGYLEIAKLIVGFASRHGVNVLKKWDQKITFHPKYCTNSFVVSHSFTPLPQVSFLTLAVKNNHVEMISYFIALYQDNCEHNRGIYEAMLESTTQPEILRILLKAFPSYINKIFKNTQVLIQHAIKLNQVKSVQVLLEFNPDLRVLQLVHPSLSVGIDCLASACKHNDTKMLKVLFDSGIELFHSHQKIEPINLLNPSFSTPIFFATFHGSIKLVKLLQEKGFDIYESQKGYFPTKSAQFNVSPIFLAVIHRKFEMLTYLLTVVDKNMLGKLQQASPVIAAVLRCCPKALQLLLDFGYSIDGTLPCQSECHYYCGDSMLDNVSIFIDDMCDLNKPVLTVLKTLLNSGVKFTSVINEELLEHCLFYLEEVSYGTLECLISAGALEYIFGCDALFNTLKKFLNEQKNFIVSLLSGDVNEHPRQVWVKVELVQLYLNNFSLFTQHSGLYHVVGIRLPCIVESVPSLKQLCRLVIRNCIMQNLQTLQSINQQPWPQPLITYLLCS